jgi:hypothetical protein
MVHDKNTNRSTSAKIFSLAADYAEENIKNIRERRVSLTWSTKFGHPS